MKWVQRCCQTQIVLADKSPPALGRAVPVGSPGRVQPGQLDLMPEPGTTYPAHVIGMVTIKRATRPVPINRMSAGVPAGGQFAATPHAESPVSLDQRVADNEAAEWDSTGLDAGEIALWKAERISPAEARAWTGTTYTGPAKLNWASRGLGPADADAWSGRGFISCEAAA